jgi:NADPH2:quinone reductase
MKAMVIEGFAAGAEQGALGKAMGTRTTGTASAAKLGYLHGLGARVAAIAARSTHDFSPLHAKGLSLHIVFSLLPILTGEGREETGLLTAELAVLADRGAFRPRLEERLAELI